MTVIHTEGNVRAQLEKISRLIIKGAETSA